VAGRTYRLRRFDSRNFVIEEPSGTRGGYRIEGYYSSPESMCRAAIRKGVGGECVEQLLASVESAYAAAARALQEAIEAGRLELPGRSAKAREKRTKGEEHGDFGPAGGRAA
jgi:hypothetical protein